MTRDDAQALLVEEIMAKGNPRYAVWQMVLRYDDAELEEHIESLTGKIVYIEDEE